MKNGLIVAGSILLVILLIVGFAGGKYNSMVTAEEDINGKWAQVDNQLQRRLDLIPNLVETVKGYAAHERETFEAITEARSKAAGAQSISESAEANAELSGALSRLMVVVENYPELKANENFIRLQDELAGTENRIATARKDYNESVQGYNTNIRRFPNSFFASTFGFFMQDYFEADEAANIVPEISF